MKVKIVSKVVEATSVRATSVKATASKDLKESVKDDLTKEDKDITEVMNDEKQEGTTASASTSKRGGTKPNRRSRRAVKID